MSTTAAEIYGHALAAIARVAETPRASVLLFDPDGVLRFKAWQGISDGYRAAVDRVSVHDLHATMLHLLGIDHEKLTYFHNSRHYRLTDVAGEVMRKILS